MTEQFVKVEWLDAVDKTITSKDLNDKVEDLLPVKWTYGLLLKDDDTGVIVMTEKDDDSEMQVVIIPKKMLVSVNSK